MKRVNFLPPKHQFLSPEAISFPLRMHKTEYENLKAVGTTPLRGPVGATPGCDGQQAPRSQGGRPESAPSGHPRTKSASGSPGMMGAPVLFAQSVVTCLPTTLR